DALIGGKFLRLVEEVAQPRAVALRLERFLRAPDSLGDARPIALLESGLAIDVRLRSLDAQPLEGERLRPPRRGTAHPRKHRIALPRGRGLLLQRVHVAQRAAVLRQLRMRGDVRGELRLALLTRLHDAEVPEAG